MGDGGADQRWLLLDVGGVLELVDDDAWPARFSARWAARAGLTTGEAAERLAAADLPDASTCEGVIDEYWQRTGRALGLPPATVDEMTSDFWDEYCGHPNTALLDALRGLPARVRLAILSNSSDGARQQEERRYGFSTLFDPVCYSHEIGALKPDPNAFRIVLSRMGADAEDVLFIDDRPENVSAARREGMHAHLHDDTARTIGVLRRFCGLEQRPPVGPA